MYLHLLLFLYPLLALGFSQQGSHSAFRQRRIASTSSRSMSSTSDITERNIFHDYDKPIVLIGFSSQHNELYRLAEGFLANEFKDTSGIVEVVQAGKATDKSDLLQRIESKTYGWPNVIIVDLAKDLNLHAECSDIIGSLYNSGLLSVFVNVQANDMPEGVNVMKESIEESTLVANSDYELCIREEGASLDSWEHIQWEFARLLARARLIPALPGDKTRTTNTASLTMGLNTFFLSLTFPEIERVEPYVEEMCKDVDAMEYRTDLLECRDSRFDLIHGMQELRRYCRPHAIRAPALPFLGRVIEDSLPIVYTVRTANQAGTYPDNDEGISQMFELLKWGLRGGVEVLDVESAWDRQKTLDLLDRAEGRYSSQILGSHHVVGKEISTEEAVLLFEQCALEGRAHAAKVVLSVNSDEKDRMAYEAGLITQELAAKEGKPVIPHISLVLGDDGQFSRVINLNFTPVTHETLPIVAAPGQMTPSEIMTTRILTKIFEKKTYAILGHKISYSVSPQMHGGAFEAVKLPHQYVRADVETVEEFANSDFFKSGSFGGTSVTIPHKQSIIPYVDILSEAASSIGSVNTVVAKDEFVDDAFKRVLYGDNTDWKGIFNPLKRHLGDSVRSTDYALILGAGGTARAAAYVSKKLGLRTVYFNRTPSKADELADTFGGIVIKSLGHEGPESLGALLDAESSGLRVVISTLPAASEFELPSWLLEKDSLPIVFDVNYKPYNTKLLLQASEAGCTIVRGSEMLWEQGVGQFELWMERTAPYGVMKRIVLENCFEEAKSL